ncbi:DUF819 family protein [Neolewinella antarctica]|uniref:Membrane protein n=1 Tax=Neolewinella antarctica TaxID=442734 RepID=A0ABX0X6S3_9BACT|nr:DUF819 family protein [Neolewinella antarctica]NJC24696.1 putative membrane protein [Neolewinella antarctica]
MVISTLLSVGLCLLFPLAARAGEREGKFPSWLSAIIACYLVGILVSNAHLWSVDNELLEKVAGASMLIGLPLLLFAVRIGDSLRYARTMLFSFLLCCVSGLICTLLVGLYMTDRIEDAWKISGMLVGLYTGGTPNVQAIGVALEAPASYLVLIQAADVLLGGAYLLGLITFLPSIYARIFRATPGEEEEVVQTETITVPLRRQVPQLIASLVVVALAVGTGLLFPESDHGLTIIILTLTTLSLIVASLPIVDRLGNTYPLGEYFILVFSVALGLMADFRDLASNGMDLLWFSFLALFATTTLHLLLSRLFNLDRDTVILSSVAAFYGPVFVVQVAASLKNQRLLAAGIAVSLFGFGIGNYLGISLANLVAWWSQ